MESRADEALGFHWIVRRFQSYGHAPYFTPDQEENSIQEILANRIIFNKQIVCQVMNLLAEDEPNSK